MWTDYKEKKVSLQPIIYYPKTDVIYILQCPTIPGGTIEIAFEGVKLANIHSVNVYSHDFKKHNGDIRKIVQWDDAFSFESLESLPLHLTHEKLPPILRRVKQNDASDTLCYVKKLTFNIDNNKTKEERECLPFTLHLWNTEIQQECQAILKKIPVKHIRSSIFKPVNLPSKVFLDNLYHKFWSYNKNKLVNQTNGSMGLCHIRAHFVSSFLSLYGIDSIKIFKLWNVEDWKKEDYGKKLRFHCAVLLIDDTHNKWVWDPWIHYSSTLLSLKDWVCDKKSSPKPMAVVLGNRNLIEDYQDEIQWLSFDACAPSMYKRVFQGLFESAVPNYPCQSLTLKNCSFRFFKEKEEESIQDNNSNKIKGLK